MIAQANNNSTTATTNNNNINCNNNNNNITDNNNRSIGSNANSELLLSTFAALLSSAFTNGVRNPLKSSKDSTLSLLLSRSIDPITIDNRTNVEDAVGDGNADDEDVTSFSFTGLALKNPKGDKKSNHHPHPQHQLGTTTEHLNHQTCRPNTTTSNNTSSNVSSSSSTTSSGITTITTITTIITTNTPSTTSSSSSQPSSIQNVTAHSLASPITANLSTIDAIPSHLLQNLTASLKRLIDSRMRSSLAALRHTTRRKGCAIDDSILRLLLVTLDPIRITTVVTSFRVVGMSSEDGGTKSKKRRRGDQDQGSCRCNSEKEETTDRIDDTTNRHRRDNRCNCHMAEEHHRSDSSEPMSPSVENPTCTTTLPLILEAIIDAKVLGKTTNLAIEAPGTITGTINPIDSLLTSVSVAFDTMALLKSLMGQARIIVKKGIQQAAYISANFKKNVELGYVGGEFLEYETILQRLQRPAPPPLPSPKKDDETAGSTTTTNSAPTEVTVSSISSSSPRPSSSTLSLSSPERTTPTSNSSMQETLLTSYPNHLRQTVEKFLPAAENDASASMTGFPSHLVNTSIRLSKIKSGSRTSRSNKGSVSEVGGSWCGNRGDDSSLIKDRESDSLVHYQIIK